MLRLIRYSMKVNIKPLIQQLPNLPLLPGIYEFFDVQNKLLYVGKAKNLHARVNSYFHKTPSLSPAKQIMVEQIHHVHFTVVKNETEALLLEGNLIKQHQPPYNVVLKDDKSWLYFAIDYRDEYPRVTLQRRPNIHGVKYFGPYPSASAARNSLHVLKKTLALRTCVNPANKPCFESALGRCLGHSTIPASREKYLEQLKLLERVLKGETKDVITILELKMDQAAKQKKYEAAARARDQRKHLLSLTIKQNVISPRVENFDVFGLSTLQGTGVIAKLPVRKGILLDTEYFMIDHVRALNTTEILSDFLEQYYPQATEKPRQVFLPVNLKSLSVPGITFKQPTRGGKRSLLVMAQVAAANHLSQSVTSWERREVRAKAGMEELKRIFKLETLPRRIEGFDISNIQGYEAVGSMVVLTNGLPNPREYRKFKIRNFNTPNDFAMLAEMLLRRFTKNTDWPKPDLVMLDGGAGQLSTVKKTLDGAKIKIPLVALAKQEELLFVPWQNEPIKLAENNPGLLSLVTLRDEAHRFGITFYRSRHRKAAIKSGWDKLPGVGPVLKRKLKANFGTLNNLISNINEIDKIIGPSRAKRLKKFLLDNKF